MANHGEPSVHRSNRGRDDLAKKVPLLILALTYACLLAAPQNKDKDTLILKSNLDHFLCLKKESNSRINLLFDSFFSYYWFPYLACFSNHQPITILFNQFQSILILVFLAGAIDNSNSYSNCPTRILQVLLE